MSTSSTTILNKSLRKAIAILVAPLPIAIYFVWPSIQNGHFPSLWFTNVIGACLAFFVLMKLNLFILHKIKLNKSWQIITVNLLFSFFLAFLLQLFLFSIFNSIVDPIVNFKEDRHFTLEAYIYFCQISALISSLFTVSFCSYFLVSRQNLTQL